jgi:transposase-like protein
MQRTQIRPNAARQSYPAAFKAQVVERFLTGDKTAAEVAHEFGLREPTVRRWIQLAASASVASHPAPSEAVVDQAPGEPSGPVSPAAWGDWPAQVDADWYDADAVRWIQESGQDVAEAAYRLGVPSATLYRWLELASVAS